MTPPEKPFKLVTLITADPDLPGWKLSDAGAADIVKSETFAVIVVDAVSDPLAAVTVIVYVPPLLDDIAMFALPDPPLGTLKLV